MHVYKCDWYVILCAHISQIRTEQYIFSDEHNSEQVCKMTQPSKMCLMYPQDTAMLRFYLAFDIVNEIYTSRVNIYERRIQLMYWH